eukprot:TRINITY_DN2709_c0_g1_i4.p1 TRINITY_DN2709_c0_g1~~TRINITY_DN2709_c0_g1_i4.p1  ORF type:complete len:307 (+),score=83.27 TRINITY_DN2709_c0_g1_i4:29-922(+)
MDENATATTLVNDGTAVREKRTYTPQEIEKIRAERKRNRVLGSASQRLNLLSGFEPSSAQPTSPRHSPTGVEPAQPTSPRAVEPTKDIPVPNAPEGTPKDPSEPAPPPIQPEQTPPAPSVTPGPPPVHPITVQSLHRIHPEAKPHTHLPDPPTPEDSQYPPPSPSEPTDPDPKPTPLDNITQLLEELKFHNESQKQKTNAQTLTTLLLALLLSLFEGVFEEMSYLLLFLTVHIGIELIFLFMSNQKALPGAPSGQMGLVVVWFGRAIGLIVFAQRLFEDVCLFIFSFCIFNAFFQFL